MRVEGGDKGNVGRQGWLERGKRGLKDYQR